MALMEKYDTGNDVTSIRANVLHTLQEAKRLSEKAEKLKKGLCSPLHYPFMTELEGGEAVYGQSPIMGGVPSWRIRFVGQSCRLVVKFDAPMDTLRPEWVEDIMRGIAYAQENKDVFTLETAKLLNLWDKQ